MMTQLKLDTKQCCLQNPLPLCCPLPITEPLSYFNAKSTFHPQIYFPKRGWHHLCVNQVIVLPLTRVSDLPFKI